MRKLNTNGFLEIVTSQIRSKEAKKLVKIELRNHLKSLIQDYEKTGISVSEAETKAIEQMGDPETIGRNMNKLHRSKTDWSIVTIFLLILGLSILPTIILEGHIQGLLDIKVKAITLGIIAILFFMLFDYRKLLKHGMFFYTIGIGILIFLAIFGLHRMGRPYLHYLGFASDATLSIPFFYLAWAAFFAEKKHKVSTLFLLFSLSILLLFFTSHLFLLFLYCALVITMLSYSPFTVKEKWLLASMNVSVLLFGIILYFNGKGAYVRARLLGYLNPDENRYGSGYIITKMRELLPEAGWFGQGALNNATILPELHTDFIFFTIIYVYGWLFALLIIVILISLSIRLIVVAKQIKDVFGRQLIVGATILFSIQFIYSILMVFGVVPITGVSFPFFSSGTMPFLFTSFLLGIVLSVYRRKSLNQLII